MLAESLQSLLTTAIVLALLLSAATVVAFQVYREDSDE